MTSINQNDKSLKRRKKSKSKVPFSSELFSFPCNSRLLIEDVCCVVSREF